MPPYFNRNENENDRLCCDHTVHIPTIDRVWFVQFLWYQFLHLFNNMMLCKSKTKSVHRNEVKNKYYILNDSGIHWFLSLANSMNEGEFFSVASAQMAIKVALRATFPDFFVCLDWSSFSHFHQVVNLNRMAEVRKEQIFFRLNGTNVQLSPSRYHIDVHWARSL